MISCSSFFVKSNKYYCPVNSGKQHDPEGVLIRLVAVEYCSPPLITKEDFNTQHIFNEGENKTIARQPVPALILYKAPNGQLVECQMFLFLNCPPHFKNVFS